MFATFLLATAHHVGHNEEVREQDQQRENVVTVGECDVAWVLITTVIDEIDGLRVHHHKLHHLSHRQGRLPPDLLGVQRDEVIGVHDRVNQSVEEDGQKDISIVAHIDIDPVEQKNTGVVIDMKEAELFPSLLGNDKEGVEKVQNF